METSIQEYSPTAAALADLASRYKGVLFEVSVPAGMATARKARAELRDYRVALEKLRVKIKAPALERVQLVDSEARRIKTAIEELENPIDAQIIKEEDRKMHEKTAALRAENDRIAAEELARKDAEAKVLAAQRAEIDRQNIELAERKRQQDAVEAEARRKIEEEQRQSRLKIEIAEKASRAIIEVAELEEKRKREAEEARLKTERDKVEAERRAVEDAKRKVEAEEEAQAKVIRDAEEAKRREIERQHNELLDAGAMLATFVKRFGHRKEFSPLVKWINQYQERKAA